MLTKSSQIVFRHLLKNKNAARAFSNNVLLVPLEATYKAELSELDGNWPKTTAFFENLANEHELFNE